MEHIIILLLIKALCFVNKIKMIEELLNRTETSGCIMDVNNALYNVCTGLKPLLQQPNTLDIGG